MQSRYRNLFFLIGMAAIAAMLFAFDMSWNEVWSNVRRTGIVFPAVLLLWLIIYMMNARAWQVILYNGDKHEIGFWRILKYTLSGYALNGVTPVGLLGGEPYRIMELTPYVGAARATSSVILYAMMHIFSHFCFWLFGIGLFLVRYGQSMSVSLAVLLLLLLAFCLAGVYVFLMGYRHGVLARLLHLFGHLPFVGRRIRRLTKSREADIRRVDQQIAALHAQRRTTFYRSLLLEFGARMLGCFEIQLILLAFTRNISFWDCVLMQAFSSFFANLFFFIPMQMGTREGGLAIITNGMHLNGAYGVLTGLITRLRDMFWIAVGLLLIRIGNRT